MATSTFWYYFSPTTPGNAAFTVDVSGSIRLGSVTGLAGEAEMGAVGEGNVVLDDPSGTVGHSSDGILGLKQFFVTENACPVGNRRLWTGYIADRRYHRGQQDSLITGVARKIDVTLQDTNAFLSFRVFAPTADDPTSDFVRPAETDLERVAALLTDVDFLSDTLFDVGYIPTTGGVDMDANDYTGQRPIDVLNDCAQVSGRNFWVKYHEATNQLVLWYDIWTTTGSGTLVYDSALRLTNVLSEHDGTTTFAITPDAVAVLDPSRLVSGVYLPYDGGTAYGTRVTTSYTYAWRDAVMPSSQVKSLAKASALVSRYLADNATEDERISCTVQLPKAKVTGIHEGMRLQVHFTHLPNVQSGFTWCRVLQRTIRQDVETTDYYWLDLELSPIPPVTTPFGILYRPQTSGTGISPDPIGWGCSGDPQPCSIATYGVQPTVGPMYTRTPGVGGSTTTSYSGWVFTGSGTIDFTSGFRIFTACGGITYTVQILINGVSVASGSCVTPALDITVTGAAIPVSAGDVLTAQGVYGGPCAIYIDGVATNFTITGGSLT